MDVASWEIATRGVASVSMAASEGIKGPTATKVSTTSGCIIRNVATKYICHIIYMHVIFKLNNCKVTKDHKHWRLVITAMRFRGMRFVSRL